MIFLRATSTLKFFLHGEKMHFAKKKVCDAFKVSIVRLLKKILKKRMREVMKHFPGGIKCKMVL